MEELVEVVQEARRIKLMHQPSKVLCFSQLGYLLIHVLWFSNDFVECENPYLGSLSNDYLFNCPKSIFVIRNI